MDYTMGLDVGITSVGWAVLENDVKGEPKRIADLGVRIFEAAENPKDGSSLAAPRRAARGSRRRLRRRKHRLERIKKLFEREDIISQEALAERYNSKGLPNVYQLRYEALHRVLEKEELAQVLLHIAKHRGFQSNRRSELKEKDNGQVLKALSANEQLMTEKQYRTVGEMFYLDEEFKMSAHGEGNELILNTRNHGGDYRHTVKRSMLVDEINVIFEEQRKMGSFVASEKLQQEYLSIMLSQRSFDLGPGKQADGTPSPYGGDMIGKMVGKCTLEQEEYRAAKACYTSERFVMAQKLSHLRMRDAKGDLLALEEEYATIEEMAYRQKTVTYAAIRKQLGLGSGYLFADLSYGDGDNLEEEIKKAEKAVCIKLPHFHDIREALGDYELSELNNESFVEYLDEIGRILTLYKSDDARLERLKELGVPDEYLEKLIELNPSKFQHLSIKAMKKIIPYLEQGFTYNRACDEAGYDFKAQWQGEKRHLLKGEDITKIINEIPNPVVKRSVSQTFKVINAIILKYGSPQSIHIELARDISKTFEDRKALTKKRDENQKSIERAKKQLMELGVKEPKDGDVLKFRLWQEQGECCMYSGKRISIDKLFAEKYAEIDHIIPYSKSFNNSYSNKVLVLAEENQNKGNRLPYEAFGKDAAKWGHFENRVQLYVKDINKKKHLLKQKLTDEDIKAGKQRSINDTRYITTFIMNVIQNYLEFAPYVMSDKVRRVIPVNGRITNFLRVRWGLAKKDRSTDTHHAMDAVLVACCTSNMIRKITNNLQAKEIGFSQKLPVYDEETGTYYYKKDYSDEAWIKMFGRRMPLPWSNFQDELDFRFHPDPQAFIREFPKEYDKFDYPEGEEDKIRAIFVSRMPCHKVTGAERKDTIRSPRHFEEREVVVSKVPLTSLKLKDGEIEHYYNKETDWLLYNALKEQLILFNGDANKAFQEDFYKPKADGTKGPLVRKVKIEEKMTIGVCVNGQKGIAENGEMIRVDVFCENGKYYFVPIYVSDVKKKELPNKAVVALKAYSKWKEMKEENFTFSLYPNDLFYFEHAKGMKGKTNKKEPCVLNQCVCYFKGANISTASFSGILHDHSASFESMGIQNLKCLKKYQVDVLGNVSEVRKEKRMHFRGC